MKIWLGGLVLLAVIAGAAATYAIVSHRSRSVLVSIVQLIAEPQRYDGDRVIFSGYLKVSRGFLRAYMTKEHSAADDDASAIFVTDPSGQRLLAAFKKCREGWAKVIGRFGIIPNLDLYGITDLESIHSTLIADSNAETASSRSCWDKRSESASTK